MEVAGALELGATVDEDEGEGEAELLLGAIEELTVELGTELAGMLVDRIAPVE